MAKRKHKPVKASPAGGLHKLRKQFDAYEEMPPAVPIDQIAEQGPFVSDKAVARPDISRGQQPAFPADSEKVETLARTRRNSFKGTPTLQQPAFSPLLLSVDDLCKLLNVSRSTVNRMQKAGLIPGRVMVGGNVRYHRQIIEAWLLAQVEATKPR